MDIDVGRDEHPAEGANQIPRIDISTVQNLLKEATHPKNAASAATALPQFQRLTRTMLPRAITQLKKNMSAEERETSDRLLSASRELIAGGSEISSDISDADSSDSDPLSNHIGWMLAGLRAAAEKHPGSSPEAQQQRRVSILEFIHSVFTNEFESDAARWGANGVNVTLRVGAIVFTGILMRDAIAFAIGQSAQLGDAEALLMATSIAVLASGPILNLIGGIESIARKTATFTSIASRWALFTLNMGLGTICWTKFGSLKPLSFTYLPFGVFTIFRDFSQLLIPMKTNISSLPIPSVLLAGGLYSFNNFLATYASGAAAPFYGNGVLPHAVGNETIPRDVIAATRLNVPHSSYHSAFNVVVELLDDVVIAALVRYFENKKYFAKEAGNIQDEAVHRIYGKNLTNIAENLLDMPAEVRETLIEEMNIKIYEEEINRMAVAGAPDDAHEQYLTKLREELHRIKLLDYQFENIGDQLKKLRPISCLVDNAAPTIDFTIFDKRLQKICKGLGATEEEGQKISREVFVYEFTRVYLPLPIFTALEKKSLASIEESKEIPLSSVPQELAKMVAAQRSKDTEGVRISLVAPKFSSFPDFLRQLKEKFLLTNAVRQGAFITVITAIVAFSGMLDGLSPIEQLLGLAAIVFISVYAAYPWLFLAHTEGDRPGRAVQGPQFSGLPQFGAEAAMEGLLTPRANDRPDETVRDERNMSEAVADREYVIESSDLSEDDIDSSSEDQIGIPINEPNPVSGRRLERRGAIGDFRTTVVNLDQVFKEATE